MGGRREVSIISCRPVTRSDLKQERSFFQGSVSSFLQLVVASDAKCAKIRLKKYKRNCRINLQLLNLAYNQGY